jgi:hypothetical protein
MWKISFKIDSRVMTRPQKFFHVIARFLLVTVSALISVKMSFSERSRFYRRQIFDLDPMKRTSKFLHCTDKKGFVF